MSLPHTRARDAGPEDQEQLQLYDEENGPNLLTIFYVLDTSRSSLIVKDKHWSSRVSPNTSQTRGDLSDLALRGFPG